MTYKNIYMAEQIKSDSTLPAQGNPLRSKVENVVMDGPKVGEFGKVGREQKVKSIVIDGVKTRKVGKIGKLQN